MKHLFITLCCVIVAVVVYSQQPAAAASGTTYGSGTTAEGAIPVTQLEKKMVNDKFEGKISGKVTEVCQEKGCWMKVENPNGEKLMVKFKDYAYFMPKDIVGKNVVLDGVASYKEVSVKQQKHYAEDAGKSKEEIEKIKEPKRELQFVAKGVLVQ